VLELVDAAEMIRSEDEGRAGIRRCSDLPHDPAKPACTATSCAGRYEPSWSAEDAGLREGSDEYGAASRVAGERGGRETFDRKRFGVHFERLTESGRRLVSLLKCVTRGSADESHVRRCGSNRSCVDAFHCFDRRQFPFGASELLGNFLKLGTYRVNVLIVAMIFADRDGRHEHHLETRPRASTTALNVLGPHRALFAPDEPAPVRVSAS
jgi:hypothetical protein